jgi:hypothetical protein
VLRCTIWCYIQYFIKRRAIEFQPQSKFFWPIGGPIDSDA